MKYILSSISFLIVVFFMTTSTVTLTGCSEVLGVGDTVRDTVSLEKLSVPTIDSVEVLAGGESAKIHFSGSFVAKEKFCGFYLLSDNVEGATVVAKDSVAAAEAWTGSRSFTVPISRDGIQTFWIASYNKSGDRSQAVPAFVFGRESSTASVYRFTVNSTSDGIDVDGTPEVKNVEEGIRAEANPVKYATNSGCDIIVEEPASAPGNLCITPIGGAVIFKSDETQIFSKAQINDIYNKSFGDTATSLSTYGNIRIYAQGRSVRDANGLYTLKAGDHFIVITSAKNVARIKVEATYGKDSATLIVYQDSGRNAGEPLYKKSI